MLEKSFSITCLDAVNEEQKQKFVGEDRHLLTRVILPFVLLEGRKKPNDG
jgi:hypothetical protein